jgi:hypothetical protein
LVTKDLETTATVLVLQVTEVEEALRNWSLAAEAKQSSSHRRRRRRRQEAWGLTEAI